MNTTRRKRIKAVWDQIDDLRLEIQSIIDEEQDSLDNMPESLQDSERGEKMQQAIYNLEDAANAIDDVIAYLQDASN